MSGGISKLCQRAYLSQRAYLGYVRGVSRLFHEAYISNVLGYILAMSGGTSGLYMEAYIGYVRRHIWAIF